MRHRHFAAQAALAAAFAFASAASTSAGATSTSYSFTGTYYTSVNGNAVALGYTGSFLVTDPVPTSVKPLYAADVTQPNMAAVWSGTSDFYDGATQLLITFTNGATVTSPVLDMVVNNTTFAGVGSPYPPGLSVQIFTRNAAAFGMTANKVCANGTINDVCDASGDDPLYTKGDASDLAVQRMTGVYFAFAGAPMSSTAAGAPNLVGTFGEKGLGVYSVTDLGEPLTTLTSFGSLSAVTTTSSVPEPDTWAMGALGALSMSLLGLRRRARSTPH